MFQPRLERCALRTIPKVTDSARRKYVKFAIATFTCIPTLIEVYNKFVAPAA